MTARELPGAEALWAEDLLDRVATRASVRRFAPTPLSDGLVERLVAGAQQSPTSDNLQAYSAIDVTDDATRRRLAHIAGHQAHVVEAPRFLVLCADLYRLAQACAMHGLELDRASAELRLTAVVDVTIFGASLALLAESLGLGTVMIGGVRNDVEAVADALALPEGCFGVFGLCLGWPAESPHATRRLPGDVVLHRDRYTTAGVAQHLRQYDAVVRAQRAQLGKRVPDEAPWSSRAAHKAARPARAGLGAALARLGFGAAPARPEEDPS